MRIKHIFITIEGGKSIAFAMKEAVATSIKFEADVFFEFNSKKFRVKYTDLISQVKSLEPDKKEPE